MDPIEHRLSAIERQLVLWRFAAAILGTGLLLFLIAGCVQQAGPSTSGPIAELQIEKLELARDGRVYAQLLIEDGGPQFRLLDDTGQVRAKLWHDDEQTALFLNDGDGHTRVGVAQFAHGGGGFALHGEESKGAAVLYLAKRKGSLSFIDADGKVLSRVAPPEQ